jgi:hypothetical protein
MADRIFGPIRGAGTQVREREPERNIVPGQLGSTVFAGIFERGAEDDITICPSNRSRRRKMGGLLDPADFATPSFASLEAARAAKEFYDHSNGAGMEINLRIVPKTNDVSNDDRPDKATLQVYNREASPIQIGTLTAHNGGRWAGQRENFLGGITGSATLGSQDFPLANQLQLADAAGAALAAKTLKRDEYKNGTLVIGGVSTTYRIVSNSSTGLITLDADVDLPADWAAAGPPAGPDYPVTLVRDNLNYRAEEKRLSVVWKDGTLDPTGTFGAQFLVDGDVLLDYEAMVMDQDDPRYWVDVINNDPNNDLVTVVDIFTGNRLAASARPANRYGESKVLGTSTLTLADPFIAAVNSPVGAWVPTLTVDAIGADVIPQRLTGTVENTGADIRFVSDQGTREYAGVIGAAITMDSYMIDVTVGAGSGVPTDGDTITIDVRTLWPDELIGGKVTAKVGDNILYTIVDNDRTTVTVTATADLTEGGTVTAGEEYRIEWPERFGGGYDGYVAGMVSADYEPLFDSVSSPLKRLKGMNMGLVKVAIPGIAKPSDAVVLQQKARELALAYNWQYRVEIPDEIETEQGALDWVNNTYGRLDLTVTFFPSFMYIRDPLARSGSEARETLVSVTGMQLGREALTARQNDGYQKAGAGVDVTLPLVVRAPVLGRPDRPTRLDEELLNPSGINPYRWASGGATIIAWGDRTLDQQTDFRFKHKREQLSHYANILLENFDWAIFQINDPDADADVLTALHAYFLAEYRKRAIRGDSFVGGRDPAAIIKMDGENNTPATRAQGDQIVDISLRFADVVERLKISIGAIGITEAG